MRVAIIGLQHETNTFLPEQTDLAAFDEGTIYGSRCRGAEIVARAESGSPVPSSGFLRAAPSLGFETVPLEWVFAEPGGPVTDAVFEVLMARIMDAIDSVGPLDAVYLDLHGAMVVDTIDDGEGEILKRLRDHLGNSIPIVASLDLHGNVTVEMFQKATALVAYRTYPHVDMERTGERAAQLLAAALRGEHLVGAFKKPDFLIPIHRQTTWSEPMGSLYAKLDEIERRPDVASISLLCGFPLSDIAECGPALLAYAREAAAAELAVEEMAEALEQSAGALSADLPDAHQAVKTALSFDGAGPAIIADLQDNPGGGGTGDTVWLLEELIAQGADQAVVAMICDPESATKAHALGCGRSAAFTLGGKTTAGHRSASANFQVDALADGRFKLEGPMSGGAYADLGPMALLRNGGVSVIVASRRTQAHDRSFLSRLGVDASSQRIIVLKSANHYRADFEPIAGTIIEAGCPGACVMDPRKMPYAKLRRGVRLGAETKME